jgi:hypothetical protein
MNKAGQNIQHQREAKSKTLIINYRMPKLYEMKEVVEIHFRKQDQNRQKERRINLFN